jgi:hypothetical protein
MWRLGSELRSVGILRGLAPPVLGRLATTAYRCARSASIGYFPDLLTPLGWNSAYESAHGTRQGREAFLRQGFPIHHLILRRTPRDDGVPVRPVCLDRLLPGSPYAVIVRDKGVSWRLGSELRSVGILLMRAPTVPDRGVKPFCVKAFPGLAPPVLGRLATTAYRCARSASIGYFPDLLTR